MKIFDTKRLRVRKLTPKEYGILQAFPMDRWEQVVSDSQAYKQFGNAVTTTVFTAIAQEIKKSILRAESEEINMEDVTDFEKTDAPGEESPQSTPETAAVTAGTAQEAAAEETTAAAGDETGSIEPITLAQRIVTHLLEETILPGVVYDIAVESAAKYLQDKADGLYIGTAPENKRDWAAAENALNELLGRYAPDGWMGKHIYPVLMPLKERMEQGERTPELFNAIVEATR